MKKESLNFYKYLEDKGYSLNTIKSYEKDLNQFCEFAKDIDVKKIDYNFIRKYLQFLYDKKYTNKSVSRHISSLKSFFKYLTKMGKIKENPCVLISSPKLEKKLPNYLNYNDLEVLFCPLFHIVNIILYLFLKYLQYHFESYYFLLLIVLECLYIPFFSPTLFSHGKMFQKRFAPLYDIFLDF